MFQTKEIFLLKTATLFIAGSILDSEEGIEAALQNVLLVLVNFDIDLDEHTAVFGEFTFYSVFTDRVNFRSMIRFDRDGKNN